MNKSSLIIGGVLVLIIGGAAFYPVNQQRIISVGTDDYPAHFALFGNRTKSTMLEINQELLDVGVILVNMRRAPQIPPVYVRVYGRNDALLAERVIAAGDIQDDTFAWANFYGLKVHGDLARIEFSAPDATKENPVGLRFELGRPDELALAVKERVSFWMAAKQFFIQLATKHNLGPALLSGLAATLVGVAIILIPAAIKISPRWKMGLYIVFLLLIGAVTVGARLNISPHLRGVSGGDAYNYLSITKQITEIKNPFSIDKRLPGWPLLLVPAFVTEIDDIWWMRWLSIMSAGGAVMLLAVLLRRWRLPWSVQVAAPMLMSWQKDFFVTSLRPEPYMFYTMLVVLAVLLFSYIERPRAQIGLGLVLGYAAMTRQEGLLLAVVIFLGVIQLKGKIGWRGWLRVGLPFLLLIMPYFVHNAVAYGNPLYTPYFEGDRNQIIDSWQMFKDSAVTTWTLLGSLWWRTWSQEVLIPLNDPYFIAGLVLSGLWLGMAGAAKQKRLAGSTFVMIAWLGMVASLLAVFFLVILRAAADISSPLMQFSSAVMKLSAGVMVIGIIPFLLYTRRQGAMAILVLITQILIALWFHPMSKHFQQDYPWLIVLIVSGLLIPIQMIQQAAGQNRGNNGDSKNGTEARPTGALSGNPANAADTKAGWSRGLALAGSAMLQYILLAPFAITVFILQLNTNALIDHMNEFTATDHVIYQAVQEAKRQPGPHGLDSTYQVSDLYFSDQAFYFNEEYSAAKQQQWLKENKIRTLVVTNLEPVEIKPSEEWQVIKHFKNEGKKEQMMESWVYGIPPEK